MIKDEHVKLNPGLPWKKAAFNTKQILFRQQIVLNFKFPQASRGPVQGVSKRALQL